MAFISIIVPVYNTEKYLEKCLDSLLSQSFEDIEIICIDDASTDNSLDIIRKNTMMDSRIKLITHATNQGTLCARKHGVEYATGQYLMFVDSDDWLDLDACKYLAQYMNEKEVDILQYGTNVIEATPLSNDTLEWIENFLEPYDNEVLGKDILEKCFLEDCFDFNITDKVWNANLCKKAFEKLEEIHLIASEDRYVFFVLAYHAHSYIGVRNARFYNYNVGVGVTGGDKLDIDRFEKRCTGAEATKAVWRFLNNENKLQELSSLYQNFEEKIIRDCVYCWYTKLDDSDKNTGYDILLKYWSAKEIVGMIGKLFFESHEIIFQNTNNSISLLKNKVVGIYYRYMGYAPMQDCIKEQVCLTQYAGCDVVLISDEDAPIVFSNDLNASIELLPASKNANWEQYKERAYAFQGILRKKQINHVIYASPTSHIAWLDILLIRSLNISVSYLNEQRELGWHEKNEQLKLVNEKNKNDIICLKYSKEYRLGYALLWFPRKIFKLIKREK